MVEDYYGDPALFFYGVARNVRHEYERKKLKPVAQPVEAYSEDLEDEHECLEKCMQTLLPNQRNLVLQYHREDKRAKIENRKRMAQQLGISTNALSIRAHRIKLALQQCVETCLGQRVSA
jgi:DNA-directed RNA polymerase specialized sigma24 family protein